MHEWLISHKIDTIANFLLSYLAHLLEDYTFQKEIDNLFTLNALGIIHKVYVAK